MNIREFVNKIKDSAEAYPNHTFSEPRRVYTCVNPYSYHMVRGDYNLYRQMDGIFVDGMTMCWWIRLLWGKKITRLSFDMSGMAVDLFDLLNRHPEKSIFLLGTKQSILEKAINNFQSSYPKMRIVGYRNGYFTNEDERQAAIEKIIKTDSDFTIVGMGSPLQEQFALDLKHKGYKGIVFTCGGFLHQSTKSTNYYPYWINKYNLRAFYRLFHEKGLWGRLFNVLIQFPILFIYDTIMTKLNNKGKLEDGNQVPTTI